MEAPVHPTPRCRFGHTAAVTLGADGRYHATCPRQGCHAYGAEVCIPWKVGGTHTQPEDAKETYSTCTVTPGCIVLTSSRDPKHTAPCLKAQEVALP